MSISKPVNPCRLPITNRTLMLSPISTYDICRLNARTIGGVTSLDFGCRFGGVVLIGVVRTQRHLVTQMQQYFAESNG
jgi:hypothetical protein